VNGLTVSFPYSWLKKKRALFGLGFGLDFSFRFERAAQAALGVGAFFWLGKRGYGLGVALLVSRLVWARRGHGAGLAWALFNLAWLGSAGLGKVRSARARGPPECHILLLGPYQTSQELCHMHRRVPKRRCPINKPPDFDLLTLRVTFFQCHAPPPGFPSLRLENRPDL